MTKQGPKTQTLLSQNNTPWAFHLSQELCSTSFQTNTKDFQSMAISVQWISLTHEQLHFLY